jgi:hypothetical protein
MTRKTMALVALGLIIPFVCLSLTHDRVSASAYQTTGYPCNIGFNGLPGCVGYQTGMRAYVYTGCGFSICLDQATAVLTAGLNDYSLSAFENTIQTDLSSSGQNQLGAAFIINNMLGRVGPDSTSVGDAESNLSTWLNEVNQFNGSVSGYTVNFNYTVDSGNSNISSTYWYNINYPYNGPGDDAFYDFSLEPTTAQAIQFSWPGNNQFDIAQLCGNLEGTLTAPLPKAPQPHGSLFITCNTSAEQYDAIVNYGDNNGYPTSGTLSAPGWGPVPVSSNSTTPIPMSVTNPYSPPSVILTVNDNGTQTQYSPNPPPPTSCTGSPICSLSLTSSTSLVDPYMPFSVIANVTYSPSQAPPTPPSMNLVITSPVGIQAYNSSQNVNGNSPTSVTFSVSALNKGTGNYTASGTLTSTYFNTITCNTTIPIVNLPYLQVYGGDTMIGASPDASTLTCDQDQSAGVYSWNRNGSPDYSGAGDQFAVQTLEQIDGYASAQSSASSPPIGLSLANTAGVNQGQGLFGGNSGVGLATSDCNFTSGLGGSPVQGSSVTLPSSVNGSDTIYATGNVYIGNNVIYTGTGNWANASKIPYLKLIVVGGNIYIDSNVTELDGLYVSEPLGGKGGTIYTCATVGLPSPDYSPSGTGAILNYYSTCNKQLTIYGSFVAQQVEFLRTYGTVGQADYQNHVDSLKTYPLPVGSTYSAEVFDYTPEMWLPRDNSTPSNSYTAITGLPPVL